MAIPSVGLKAFELSQKTSRTSLQSHPRLRNVMNALIVSSVICRPGGLVIRNSTVSMPLHFAASRTILSVGLQPLDRSNHAAITCLLAMDAAIQRSSTWTSGLIVRSNSTISTAVVFHDLAAIPTSSFVTLSCLNVSNR
jgi:hypothetical protein